MEGASAVVWALVLLPTSPLSPDLSRDLRVRILVSPRGLSRWCGSARMAKSLLKAWAWWSCSRRWICWSLGELWRGEIYSCKTCGEAPHHGAFNPTAAVSLPTTPLSRSSVVPFHRPGEADCRHLHSSRCRFCCKVWNRSSQPQRPERLGQPVRIEGGFINDS
jgi:hypothetical protein